MEFILATATTIFAITMLWPFWIGFACMTFWLCAEEEWKFFGFLATLLIGSIVVRTFGIGWEEYKIYLMAYPFVGILWSFYRWERYGQYVRTESQERHNNNLERFNSSYEWQGKGHNNATEEDYKQWRQKYQREHLELRSNVGKISYWITSWPVSILTWGLHDILTFVKRFITVYARKVYVTISERHIEK